MNCKCKMCEFEIDCKRQRRMLMKLRDGTPELRIETGRWCGLRRDELICNMCDRGEMEDASLLHSRLDRTNWKTLDFLVDYI